MKRFEDLIVSFVLHKATSTLEDFKKPAEQQQRARQEFPLLAEQAGFHLWQPGDSIADQGTRFLIGIETASRYDMILLDALADAMVDGRIGEDRIDLFDVAEIKSMADFEHYIPGIGDVYQTPVVGYWENGVLQQKAWGAGGRNLLIRHYRLPERLTHRPS